LFQALLEIRALTGLRRLAQTPQLLALQLFEGFGALVGLQLRPAVLDQLELVCELHLGLVQLFLPQLNSGCHCRLLHCALVQDLLGQRGFLLFKGFLRVAELKVERLQLLLLLCKLRLQRIRELLLIQLLLLLQTFDRHPKRRHGLLVLLLADGFGLLLQALTQFVIALLLQRDLQLRQKLLVIFKLSLLQYLELLRFALLLLLEDQVRFRDLSALAL